jgi:hypothetical protein
VKFLRGALRRGLLVALLCFALPWATTVFPQTPSASSQSAATLSESQARKLLMDSPWAKRVKIHSIITSDNYSPSIQNPGANPGGLGPGGPGHGVVPPTAEERVNQMQAGKNPPIPCLGWGFGSMAQPSPTSDECWGAKQSLALAESAGLPKDAVIVLWDSAAPIHEAKSRLDIPDSDRTGAGDTVVISVIAHPFLSQINLTSPEMRQLVKDSVVLLVNGKDEVHASNVAFIEADRSVIRFLFPRQPLLQSSAKTFVFRFTVLDTSVETKFNLKDMVFAGKPAL